MPWSYADVPALARSVANRHRRRYRRLNLDAEDLYQEAYLAMMPAVKAGISDEGHLLNDARSALRAYVGRELREQCRRIPDATYSPIDEEMVSNLPDSDQSARPPGLAAVCESALVDPGPGPARQAVNNELYEAVWDNLPFRQAGAVVLCYWYGMTDAEIGTYMSVSAAAAKMARHRGLKKLEEVAPDWRPE